MGNPKQKWTAEEEEALKKGVAKHGTGKWKNIQRDPEFNQHLFSRSNIDLKDKWRNMTVSSGSLTLKEKVRPGKPKTDSEPHAPAEATAPSLTPLSITQSSASASVTGGLAVEDTLKSVDDVKITPKSADDVKHTPKSADDGRTTQKYNELIYEALSALNAPNGADTSAIVGYIEQREEMPHNFRRQLSSRLRRLVAQDKLEKVQNCFKIKVGSSIGTKPPITKQKDVRPRPVPSTVFISPGETIEEAATAAAYRVAEAENKSFVAAEAVKEAERIAKMAEDTESLWQLANEINEKCSRGEVVIVT